MNKEKFHNELAMRLGYERIVNGIRFTIDVDDSDEVWVTLKFQDYPEAVRFKASGKAGTAETEMLPEMQNEVKVIFDAVRLAYNEANKLF